MKIKALYRYNDLNKGEWPNLVIDQHLADEWWGRDPFEDLQVQGVSPKLLMDPAGTLDGHNLITDSSFTDSMWVDHDVPLSPLFVKDLVGRTIYIGYGPERKGNAEWAPYMPVPNMDGSIPKDLLNPFVPMVAFPRYCRDVENMEGSDLLEHVFLTKFRCLEMSSDYNAILSGKDEDEDLVAATYLGANLYPYKLRLDTYYTDGYKLPQMHAVYARGENEGINPGAALRRGEELMAKWRGRVANSTYEQWFETMGEDTIEGLYQDGCTLIPTFEGCNGYHVVGRDFGLEDYWPGRAVLGLHDVVERRADKAPVGTILEVIQPGYVTATLVKPAQVIVSDGSGYVSPNNEDPLPLVPNMNMPHQRTLDSWYATWLPTHPEHFEAPAIWGWDLSTGRFMQLAGPLWDPLHYYYASVDHVLGAFEKTPLPGRRGLVPVPEEMDQQFYPIVPLKGFETFSVQESQRRAEKGVLPRSMIKRVPTEGFTAGIGYHPMPAEYEFELDTFWFPEMHPLNRSHGGVPDDLAERVAPVVSPKVVVSTYLPTVDAPKEAEWLTDEGLLFTPIDDPLVNYPQLMRYVDDQLPLEEVVRLCPVPFLSDPGEKIKLPAPAWWLDSQGNQMDGPLALQEIMTNVHDALWDMRQEGVEIVQLRHLIYRTNLPLYMLAWWYGWSVEQMRDGMVEWMQSAEAEVERPLDAVLED